ncbi:MAG: GNAT family N-acetyltransferase [Clostridium sp.]|nr:MAG: GNAT family N-acetyltransferase [Clostridium sp.]
MIEYNKLTFEEYKMLLNDVGWKLPSERLVKISLEKGINVKYVLDSKTVGMASFVTNGGYAGLIMDVVVLKEYRGKGYGTILIESILNYIKKNLENDEEMMIQLLSAPGKQDFYSKFGFKVKKEIAEDGMYMWLRKGVNVNNKEYIGKNNRY